MKTTTNSKSLSVDAVAANPPTEHSVRAMKNNMTPNGQAETEALNPEIKDTFKTRVTSTKTVRPSGRRKLKESYSTGPRVNAMGCHNHSMSQGTTQTTTLARPHSRRVPPYEPGQSQPFPLSRSKLSNYMTCPRCFFLDARFKLRPPSGPAFTLNGAVDALLKREFDDLRAKGEPHPELAQAGVPAVPFQHPDLGTWRDSRKGIRFLHQLTGLELYGGIDDLLVDPVTGKLHVIDFKATAKRDDITKLEGGFSDLLRRQVEVYQYILRKMGHDVSDIAYFYYVNGCADRPGFNGRLDFRISIISHQGDASWIEPTLRQIKNMLEAPHAPEPSEKCAHCQYLVRIKENI